MNIFRMPVRSVSSNSILLAKLALQTRCLAYTCRSRTLATISKVPEYDDEFDTIVIGSGAGGLTAALTAASRGSQQRVLVAEKTGWFGGTSAYSGGALWIPMTKLAKDKGYVDSREAVETYLRTCVGEAYDEELVSAYLTSGPEMVSWLQSTGAIDFLPSTISDYYMTVQGSSKAGRTLLNAPYDGRRLGSLVKHVRYPLQGLSALGSMQIDPSEIFKWQSPMANWSNLSFVAKRLIRFAVDQIQYGKGSFLCNGNALVGRLLESAIKNGVTLWRNSPATEPILEGNRVVGVSISHNGRPRRIRARKGVILASGGFSRSSELTRKYSLTSNETVSPRGNVGDGIQLGLASGGSLPLPLGDNNVAVWAPISEYHAAKGPIRKYPHLFPNPGSIIVNEEGKRFANESAPYQDFGRATHTAKVRKEYLIGDSRSLRRYGMGMALPSPYPLYNIKWRKYLTKAPTLSALAIKLGLDTRDLASTIERFNRFAREGKDLDFRRGDSSYDQSHGDQTLRPNPCLLPIDEGPFYAIPMYPGNLITLYGLNTNQDAQVLNASGSAIPGLYAIGADANHFLKGRYASGGVTLGPSMVFGYRAGLHLR